MQDFARDYLENVETARAFFARAPEDLFVLPDETAPWDDALVRDLAAYQDQVGGAGRVRGDEHAVVTGQQAGILTGPLYTVLKAATAVLCAQRLREQGRKAVPVFWVHSDDHDLEEVRSATILTKSDEPLTLNYEPKLDVAGRPIAMVPAEPSLHDIVDRAARAARGAEHRDAVRSFLHESLDASASLAEWFARCMARLFAGTSLVLFDPALDAARRLARPIFARDIEHPLHSTDLLAQGADAVAAAGYAPQVQKQADECNFFLTVQGRREKLVYRDGEFHAPGAGKSFSAHCLLALLETAPDRFTANVALRPVVQQQLFPAAAYVAGPGEIAYWAQLGPVFRFFELPMPVVYPRLNCTLSTLKWRILRERYGFSLEDLLEPEPVLMERALRANPNNALHAVVRAERGPVQDAVERLVAALGRGPAPAAEMARGMADQVARQLDRIELTILRQDRAHEETVRNHVTRLQNTLAPGRKPQDRVYSIATFLFEHGWELVPRILRELELERRSMQEILV